MKYQPYPAYKDSGVEWLGEIPEGWEVSKLKYICKCNPEVLPENCDPNFEIRYIEISDVQFGAGITQITQLTFKNAPSRARRIVQAGDIIISTVRTYLKAIAQIDEIFNGAIVSTGFAVFRPIGNLPAFLHHLFHAEGLHFEIISKSTGVSYPAINSQDLISIPVPLPPLSTQQSIAAFLDKETARIDSLIKDYEELIALLKEKRQALISHAVTRGLSELVSPDDPEFGKWAKPVKFKDSGVEWLGQIPEEWIIRSIKWITPVQRGASPRPIDDPKYFDKEGEYAWVRISDVTSSQDGYLVITTDQLSDLGASLSVKLEPGSLFISIAGTVGKPCITKIKACIHDGFVYFPLLNINPKFFFRIFESGLCYGGLGKFGTQLNLNTDTIGSIQIGVPPIYEIEEIVQFLDTKIDKIDSLVIEIESAISLIKEHRSALITNAVTGKINVEGLA